MESDDRIVQAVIQRLPSVARGPLRFSHLLQLSSVSTMVLMTLRSRWRSEPLQVLLFRVLIQSPIIATQVSSVADIVLAAVAGGRRLTRLGGGGLFIWGLMSHPKRRALSTWLALEAMFYAYFLWRRRSLQRRRHLPPMLHQRAVGRREKALRKSLRQLEKVIDPENVADGTLAPSPLGRRRTCGTGGLGSPSALHRSAAELLSHAAQGHFKASSSLNSQSPNSSFSAFAVTGLRSSASKVSMEAVLRTWEQERPVISDHEVQKMALRQAEIRSFFFGAELSEIKWRNVAEWIAEYFFEGRSPEEIRLATEKDELRQMVTAVAEWVSMPGGGFGEESSYNASVKCMRLSRDRLIAEPRPLWVYVGTTLLLPAIAHQKCRWMGFEKYVSGGLEYWYRPAMKSRLSSSRMHQEPIVFCHGLGVGVLPYLTLIEEMCAMVDTEIFLLDMPHLASRPKTDVPSPREAVACICDMLAAWGHASAHFIGHSFGTVVITWVLRRSEIATSVVLLDPVCFLLVKSDLLANVLYSSEFQAIQDFRTAAFQFFIFRELYIAHTLTRNFFWQENDLTPENLSRPAIVLLSGKDTIVAAHSVRRLLESERKHRQEIILADKLAQEGASLVLQRTMTSNAFDRQVSNESTNSSEDVEFPKMGRIKSAQMNALPASVPQATRRKANVSLDIIFRPEAGHSDCWENASDRKLVLESALRLFANSEGRGLDTMRKV